MKKTKNKRFLASLFALFMCVILLLPSCGEINDPENSQGSQVGEQSSTGGNSGDNPDSGEAPPPWLDLTQYRGKTLNVLATTLGGEEASAPWSQPELTGGGFGEIIDSAIIQRNEQIAEEYGVSINWINARSGQIASLLAEADAVGTQRYHIAMPRVTEAQSLVEKNLVYDLANSGHIDLTRSYYRQAATEAYTVNNLTLFVSGDFTFLDEASSYVTFYNAAMLEGLSDVPDFYELVRSGSWTTAEMTDIARFVTKNNGEAQWTDNDVYGFGTQGIVQLYAYGGIRQVSVENSQYEQFKSSPNLNGVIEGIMGIKGATYARTEWDGDPVTAFNDGRLLFYNAPLQSIDNFKAQGDEFKVGILPNPKLNTSQEGYYTPVGEQAVLMCVPKCTEDRLMSDAFVRILSQTGSELLTPAYLEKIKDAVAPELADQSIEMLTEYVFGGMVYDQGYINGTLTQVFENMCSGYSGIVLDNTALIEEASRTVSLWNMYWMDYLE